MSLRNTAFAASAAFLASTPVFAQPQDVTNTIDWVARQVVAQKTAEVTAAMMKAEADRQMYQAIIDQRLARLNRSSASSPTPCHSTMAFAGSNSLSGKFQGVSGEVTCFPSESAGPAVVTGHMKYDALYERIYTVTGAKVGGSINVQCTIDSDTGVISATKYDNRVTKKKSDTLYKQLSQAAHGLCKDGQPDSDKTLRLVQRVFPVAFVKPNRADNYLINDNAAISYSRTVSPIQTNIYAGENNVGNVGSAGSGSTGSAATGTNENTNGTSGPTTPNQETVINPSFSL